MSDFCQTSVSDILGSFLGRDDSTRLNNDASGDEKRLDKTGDLTEETASSSFVYDNSTSFASWLSSQDFDNSNIITVPSLPDSPHLLGIDADDETHLSEELRHNDGTSPEETYDGSKPVAEWLSSRDANHVVVTSPSPQQHRNAQFEGLMFKSADEQYYYEGGNKNMSPDAGNACNNQTKNDDISTTLLNNFCDGSEVARIISETCGCTIITQLNDLLDTRHCERDIQDDNHHRDDIIDVDGAVEVPLENGIIRHRSRCSGTEEETSETEREDMVEISLNASFEAPVDDAIENNNSDEETNISEKEENDDCLVHAVTPEKQINDGGKELRKDDEEEDFPIDEMNAPAVTPSKSFDDHIDEGTRLKLSQMLLDTSLFQPNNNEWSSGFQANNDSWRGICNIDGDEINTADLESLDDVLNDHDEIFRNTEPRGPPSLSQEVHLLGASFEDSHSSDHGSVFERVLREENRARQPADVDVTQLKKIVETRKSLSDGGREHNQSRRLTNSRHEDESKGSRVQNNSRIDGHLSSKLSLVNNRERESNGMSQPNSRKEDSHFRPSSVSGGEEEPKIGKENTIIVMSIRGRKGKDKYARHARKQRLASKAAKMPS